MDIAIFEKKLKEVDEWLAREYTGIRTGQAAPALLDSIRVESYGSMMPLVQVGSISIEDARTLRISPWDAGAVAAIERAIKEADLGVSIAGDSSGLRVIFPELTSERRDQLMKLAKSKLEDARVSVRAVRDDMMKFLDKAQKEGDISEDQKFTLREKSQKLVDAVNATLENQLGKKELEIKK